MMSFDITRAVVVHSVRLGCRLAVDVRSTCSSTFKVSIDVVHLHVRASAYTRQCTGRKQLVAGGHAMQPNHGITCPDLRVHGNALVISFDAARRKSESLD